MMGAYNFTWMRYIYVIWLKKDKGFLGNLIGEPLRSDISHDPQHLHRLEMRVISNDIQFWRSVGRLGTPIISRNKELFQRTVFMYSNGPRSIMVAAELWLSLSLEQLRVLMNNTNTDHLPNQARERLPDLLYKQIYQLTHVRMTSAFEIYGSNIAQLSRSRRTIPAKLLFGTFCYGHVYERN